MPPGTPWNEAVTLVPHVPTVTDPETFCVAGKLLTDTCEPNETVPETPTVPALKTLNGKEDETPIVAGQFWTTIPPLIAWTAGKLLIASWGRFPNVTGSEDVTLTQRGLYGALPTARPSVPVVEVAALIVGVGLSATDPVTNKAPDISGLLIEIDDATPYAVTC